jgi:hypothetical protein
MTAEGALCETKNVDFELVDKPARRGRPTLLTARVFLKICRHIEHGFSAPNGCSMEGVSYRISRLRCSHSARLKQRLKQAEDVRGELRRELALEGIMRVAERGNWLAYAWICERTAPHLYALRSVSRVVEEDQQFEEPIPGEILAKHRQFYAEMLLEDQAKSQSRSAGDSVEQINQTSGKQIGQL